jgi:hypothetical protein
MFGNVAELLMRQVAGAGRQRERAALISKEWRRLG